MSRGRIPTLVCAPESQPYPAVGIGQTCGGDQLCPALGVARPPTIDLFGSPGQDWGACYPVVATLVSLVYPQRDILVKSVKATMVKALMRRGHTKAAI